MNSTARSAKGDFTKRLIAISSAFLVATVWISALTFGLYILVHYAYSLFSGEMIKWNELLPGLYDPENRPATVGIGIHFLTGGIILVLGCIQLIRKVRVRFPTFHRWVGRVYVIASLLTAIGGLAFIFLKGTIGGWVMDIGFGLYGVLTFYCAIETYRHARAQQFERHRAWAIRLFALAIGSWLYRMEYGFYFVLVEGAAKAINFKGPFDYFMDFFFYVPNLIIAEIFIGRVRIFNNGPLRILAALGMVLVSCVLLIGSYYFTKELWGPAIVGFFANL